MRHPEVRRAVRLAINESLQRQGGNHAVDHVAILVATGPDRCSVVRHVVLAHVVSSAGAPNVHPIVLTPVVRYPAMRVLAPETRRAG